MSNFDDSSSGSAVCKIVAFTDISFKRGPERDAPPPANAPRTTRLREGCARERQPGCCALLRPVVAQAP
eukprot:14571832-Alexandrium_andersonii.AAC.1